MKFTHISKKQVFKNDVITVFEEKLGLPNNNIVTWTFTGKKEVVAIIAEIIPKIFIKIFFICGISNSLNEILNFLLTGCNNKKSNFPVFINSGSLFSPGTTANVNTESISPP